MSACCVPGTVFISFPVSPNPHSPLALPTLNIFRVNSLLEAP